MRTVRAKITIDRPIEEVYDYLLDIATRPEFGSELFQDFRLTRVDSHGLGAGARFRLHPRVRDRFAGTTIVKAVPGEMVVEEGSTGRSGRVPLAIEYLLEEQPGGVVRVLAVFETSPLLLTDRIREFGFRRTVNRRLPRALRRMRDILEQAPRTRPGRRPTVAATDRNRVPNP